jgi:hypothetical protein
MASTTPSTFTYQGQLQKSNALISDACDFEFMLYDAETDGSQVGSTNAFQDVSVQGGFFQVDLDFGAGAFEAGQRWLSVLVDCGGTGPLVELAPRQRVDPAPLAQYAATAGTVLNSPENGWTVSGDDVYTSVPGGVGIGTTSPINALDVNGKISLTQSPGSGTVINASPNWQHGAGPQVFGNGGSSFLLASYEGSFESAGIHGDGDSVTIWSPGDGADGQPAALLYILDEDSFDGSDTDPYNGSALAAYVNTSGAWVQASDANRKSDVEPMQGALDRLLQVNGYQYRMGRPGRDSKPEQVGPQQYGLLAQEIETVFPAAVEKSDAGDYFLSYSALVPALIEAIKEQQATIDQLNAQNAALARRLDTIEANLAGQPGS